MPLSESMEIQTAAAYFYFTGATQIAVMKYKSDL